MKKISKKLKITIDITEEQMDAIEDNFFCELSEEEYKNIRPLLLDVWECLCDGVDENLPQHKEGPAG